jgi:hypothetical protein
MHDMPPTPRSAQPRSTSREMKRLLVQLVGAVVVLDAAVIGLYYALQIEARPIKQQQMFVATMMKRIRVARRRR